MDNTTAISPGDIAPEQRPPMNLVGFLYAALEDAFRANDPDNPDWADDFDDNDVVEATLYYTHRMTMKGWDLIQLREAKHTDAQWREMLNWQEGTYGE